MATGSPGPATDDDGEPRYHLDHETALIPSGPMMPFLAGVIWVGRTDTMLEFGCG